MSILERQVVGSGVIRRESVALFNIFSLGLG